VEPAPNANGTAEPTSLAEWLRARPDTDLAELLRRRPDLALPAPSDVDNLSQRIDSRISVQRVVDGLDEPHLAVLTVIVAGHRSAESVASVLPDLDVPALVTDLLDLALVWGSPASHGVPAGVLAAVEPGSPTPPAATPPPVAATERPPSELDRLGGGVVLELLRLADALAMDWTAQPPALLRSGGLSVRDLRRTARTLSLDEPTTVALVETMYAAGLINMTPGVTPVYLPTDDYDAWASAAPAVRWTRLASTWLSMTRQPSLVGQKGERERTLTALSPDIERGTAPAMRAHVLDVLTELPPGAAPVRRADVLARLAWHAPRRAAAQRLFADAILAEADFLGLTAAGGLTGYTRTLRAGSRAVAEQVLTDALPTPVGEFLLQPDLTAVVPGPPTPLLARELSLVADLESSGGASVYRLTEATVRRALDAGRAPEELVAFLTERSRTPIPQALSYLIADAAKRHGNLRVGLASTYLRCDDASLLDRVVADKTVAGLGLRRLAPTVVVSAAPLNRMLEVLRAAGHAPAAESADGDVVSLVADAPRAPGRPPDRSFNSRVAGGDSLEHRLQLVRRMRSGDQLHEMSRRVQPLAAQVPGVTSAATMGQLRGAIREGRKVLLGCAEADGTTTRHTILPISLAGGFVRGHDPETQTLKSFPLHRLTGVAILDD
jgi:hypothetical protein